MSSLIRLRANENRFGRVLARVSLMLAFGACLVLALMMYVIFADVVLRYFFNAPIKGSVEIIFCLMGLLVAMGFGLATYEVGHVKVDIVTSALPPRLRAVLEFFANMLASITVCLMTWRLAVTVLDQVHERNITQVLELPVWLVAAIMALCTLMLVLTMALHLIRSAVRAFGPLGGA